MNTQTYALKLVFSNKMYLAISIPIAVSMFILLSYISEFIFFEPYLTIYIPTAYIPSFITIVIVSILSSIVITMNIFKLKAFRGVTGITGSVIGVGAGACGCGPVGFSLISLLGTAGGTATAFLTNYELPLRLVSIAILLYAYYTTAKSFKSCSV
ncbi:MAG: hypothetical protein D6752_01975 [Candidatus Nitrosothermus koennekii]|nr:MAG: hypothetical protein D6752_01975 [Candidatus Nitrosothermus koennekii]